MKIACVGGGPGGLYLSILLKLRDSGNEVTVYERNKDGSRSGWGVTFGPGLLAELYRQDPGTARQLEAAAEIRWQGTVVRHRGERHAEPGDPNFVVHSISRRQMIDIFTSRAEALGVNFEYDVSVTSPAALPWADVIVAADGVKSQLRSTVEGLGTRIATRTSKYIWLGSTTVYRPLTYLFVESPHGWLCGHTYGIDSATSAFFVECAEQTWTGLGFNRMSTSEALPVLYNLFSEYLDGGRLLGTLPDGSDARWQNFTTVSNQHWRSGNVVLIGDAAHTNYPSTGMGTTLAFQDGVCLADALHSGRDIPSALESYERQRKRAMLRPTFDAAVNARWFDNALRHADFLSPVQLATLLFARSSPLLGILPPRLAYLLKQMSKRVAFLAAIRDRAAPVVRPFVSGRR